MRVRSERKKITRSSDGGKSIAAKNFHRNTARKFREIQFHRLREAGQIHDNDNSFVVGAAEKCQYLWIFREQKLERPTGEGLVILSHGDDPPHPPQQRREILLLILDVDRFVVVFRINRDRKIKLLRIRFGKSGVTIGAPLHRGATAIAIAE